MVKHVEVNGWSKVTRNEVLGYRTRLAIERKDYAEALKLNNEQLPEAKELDINAYSEVLKQRAIIMANTGRWQEGYHALDEHYELVDSNAPAVERAEQALRAGRVACSAGA